MISRRLARLAAAGALLTLVPAAARPQAPATEYEGAAALGLALRQIGTTKRVLMIGAHPDDESTQILGTLALGQGAQVAYLSLTRGEGGQNGIGPELQEPLGLLRTEELLAARRLDGARQFFTRAYDYGFSKNAEEAFRHWPHDSLLADVVAVVREFRPDVILAVFSGTPTDGHGQHQASGILAREAFEVAADPRRFPEQLRRGLRPHASAKLYQALWRRDEGATERLETGELDPLFGRSYFQAAMASRSRHRSQDMGQILEPGPQTNALRLVSSRVGGASGGLFAGIDTTLAGIAASEGDSGVPAEAAALLTEYQARAAGIQERFNPLRPDGIVPELAEMLSLLGRAEASYPGRGSPRGTDLHAATSAERAELSHALALAAGVQVDAIAAQETVVPGESFELATTVWNGGTRPISVAGLAPRAPAGWKAEPLDTVPDSLAPGTLLTRRFRVTVPADAELTQPYFLRRPRDGDLYRWPAELGAVGVPFEAPVLAVAAGLRLDGVPLEISSAATFRGLDKMQGEFRRPLRIVPAVGVRLEPGLAILPLAVAGEPRHFTVRLRAEAPEGIDGMLRLRVPEGWSVQPAALPVRFSAPGEEHAVEVEVRAPAGVGAGEFPLSAAFEAADGRIFERGYELVDYPHTRPRPLYRPATATLRALDVRIPAGLRVGYVAGPGDEVPQALAQLGLQPTLLGPGELASGGPRGVRRDRHRDPRLRGPARPAYPQRAAAGVRAPGGDAHRTVQQVRVRGAGHRPLPHRDGAPARSGGPTRRRRCASSIPRTRSSPPRTASRKRTSRGGSRNAGSTSCTDGTSASRPSSRWPTRERSRCAARCSWRPTGRARTSTPGSLSSGSFRRASRGRIACSRTF